MSHKNQDIEILRAFAVLMTMMAHLFWLFPWRGGDVAMWGAAGPYVIFWTGVDLFFCISGFVISKSFLESLDAARETAQQWVLVKAFWVRRAYRLLPTSWFWVAFTLICSFALNHSGAFGHHREVLSSAVMAVTNTMNFGGPYGESIFPPMGVYWSLSLEEQFYLVFPFFLILMPVAWRWKVLLALIAVQFPLARSGILMATRLDAMMWGIVIYLFSRTREYRTFEPVLLASRRIGCMVTLGLLVGLITIPATLSLLPFRIGMVAVIAGFAVFIASYDRQYTLPIPALRPTLVWVGSRSYSIYLAHFPAYLLTHEIWYRLTVERGLPEPGGTYMLRYAITAIMLTATFSELSYRFLEVPFRKRGSTAARKLIDARREAPQPAI